MAFDELVSIGGVREDVSVQQVRLNIGMDSHEEKMAEMLQKSKEREAVEAMKLKARQLDIQKRQERLAASKNASSMSSVSQSTSMSRQAASSY